VAGQLVFSFTFGQRGLLSNPWVSVYDMCANCDMLRPFFIPLFTEVLRSEKVSVLAPPEGLGRFCASTQ
jgi:hypothetical protein